MALDPNTLSVVALAGAGIGAISLVFGVRSSTRLRRMRRAMRSLQAPVGPSPSTHVIEDVGDVIHGLLDVNKRLEDIEISARLAVQHVGLVRFDAFEDMGGHLSFSAALLDSVGDGLVLTSINGRQETRIYAKPIEAGASRYTLSSEEHEAVRRAFSPKPSAP